MRVPEINVALGFPSNSHRVFSCQGNNTNSAGYLGGMDSAIPLGLDRLGASLSILEIVWVGAFLKPQTLSLFNLPASPEHIQPVFLVS